MMETVQSNTGPDDQYSQGNLETAQVSLPQKNARWKLSRLALVQTTKIHK